MKMGEIATKLGEVRLDNMRGFGGMFIDKESLWKLLFSFSVNTDAGNHDPEWVKDLFEKLTGTKEHINNGYTHASGVPFGYTVNESTGQLEKI